MDPKAKFIRHRTIEWFSSNRGDLVKRSELWDREGANIEGRYKEM